MSLVTVSVVIVTYNAAATLQRSIDSVIRQSFISKELLVIDGGSTDATLQILHANRSHIVYQISEPDSGIYDAMNKGIQQASGEWILFLGDDDQLCEEVLARVFSKSWPDETAMIYGKVFINGGKKTQGATTSYERLIAQNTPHQAIFYRRTLLQELGGYRLKYKILADYDLNLRVFKNYPNRVQFINTEVAYFSSRGVSNRTIDKAFFDDKLNEFISDGISPGDSRLAKYYFFLAVAHSLQGQQKKAIQKMLYCIRITNQPFYYGLLAMSFILAQMGIGRRYFLANS